MFGEFGGELGSSEVKGLESLGWKVVGFKVQGIGWGIGIGFSFEGLGLKVLGLHVQSLGLQTCDSRASAQGSGYLQLQVTAGIFRTQRFRV